jgi:hypothetical protein
VSEQTELRERLRRLADDTAPEARGGLADVITARHRAQRRERRGLAGVAVAVAAVVVGGSVLVDDSPRVASAPLAVPASGTDEATAQRVADVYAGPTRGSLVRDTPFIEAIRTLPWNIRTITGAGAPEVPLRNRHVVFAGDVGTARVVLVAGRGTVKSAASTAVLPPQTDRGSSNDTAVAWFVGPAGSAAGDMRLAHVSQAADPAVPVGLFDPATGALVVVAEQGSTLELSLGPAAAPDGSDRTWQPAPMTDGVAALDLREEVSGQAIRYRVRRGAESWLLGPDIAAPYGSVREPGSAPGPASVGD